MLSNAIFSILLISSLAKVPLPVALEQGVYPVPTVTSATTDQKEARTTQSPDFEWRLLQKMHGADAPHPPAKKTQAVDPVIHARTAILVDGKSQHVLWQKNPDEVVPIASITKLMSALVWFDAQPTDGLAHVHTIAPEGDRPAGKELDLPYGKQLTALNLLNGALVASDNDLVAALADTTGLSQVEYLAQMNAKAKALGMNHTTFKDETGLSDGNRATAADVARLAQVAFWNHYIQRPAGQPVHLQETIDGSIKNTLRSTNELLTDKDIQVLAGKTGFTYEAGYCVVVKVRVPESAGGKEDDYVLVVVLGTGSSTDRFVQAKKLAQWAFTEYQWGNNVVKPR